MAVVAPAAASAATRFVAKNGSDSSDCTSSGLPCLTIAYAVSQATDGDTIQIGPGTYNEAVSTPDRLDFVGAGGGSLPVGPAATVIQGPAGGFGQSGETALELSGGGSVRELRAVGGAGGTAGQFGELGGDGIRFDSNTAASASLALEGVVAIAGAGGPGSLAQGPGGDGLTVRSQPGPVTLQSTDSDFQGGIGLAPGQGVSIIGAGAKATIARARIANDDRYGSGLIVFSDAVATLDSVDIRSLGEAAGIYDGVLDIHHSHLHGGSWGLFVYPSSQESPELELVDSLVVSDQSEALFVESEEESPAVARVFGSTLIARGLAAVMAKREGTEGPATVTIRNSVIRHYPPADIVPRADLDADGGTISADFSSFATRIEENGGTATAPGSGANIASDPGFVDPSQDVFVLRNDSPLIDRGDPGVVQPGELDLLGAPRSLDGNRDCLAAPDMGAFEVTGQSIPCDIAPEITQFGVTNKVFAPVAGKAGAKRSALISAGKKVKRGTRFVYTLSEAAKVTIAVERRMKGRRTGRGAKARCVKATRTNRQAPRCVRFAKVTSLGAQAKAGKQSLFFSGRVRGKALKPGPYRATIVAKDAAGHTSTPRRVNFRIVRG